MIDNCSDKRVSDTKCFVVKIQTSFTSQQIGVIGTLYIERVSDVRLKMSRPTALGPNPGTNKHKTALRSASTQYVVWRYSAPVNRVRAVLRNYVQYTYADAMGTRRRGS